MPPKNFSNGPTKAPDQRIRYALGLFTAAAANREFALGEIPFRIMLTAGTGKNHQTDFLDKLA